MIQEEMEKNLWQDSNILYKVASVCTDKFDCYTNSEVWNVIAD